MIQDSNTLMLKNKYEGELIPTSRVFMTLTSFKGKGVIIWRKIGELVNVCKNQEHFVDFIARVLMNGASYVLKQGKRYKNIIMNV